MLAQLEQQLEVCRDPKVIYERYITNGNYRSASSCQSKFNRQQLSDQARRMLDTQFSKALKAGQLDAAKAWHQLGAILTNENLGEFVTAKNWRAIKTVQECSLEIPQQIQTQLSNALVNAMYQQELDTARLLFDMGIRIPEDKVDSLQALLFTAASTGNYDMVSQLNQCGLSIGSITLNVLNTAIQGMQQLPEMRVVVAQLQQLVVKATPPLEQPEKKAGSSTEQPQQIATVNHEQKIKDLIAAVRKKDKDEARRIMKSQGFTLSEPVKNEIMDIVRDWTALFTIHVGA
ncbi:hypothetical protein [Parendozoicomonas sp. Alg238-R29]|uniref:hypothetical protein n=1 Tax=Parendozoicomonas sp. Alg238-R29 TaxID=2993446 RepID=UPI00248E16A4|nr:hypothetical protein [Parendozoicomonas sp. Alg238-R29]